MHFSNPQWLTLSLAILFPFVFAQPSFLPRSPSLFPRGEIPFEFTHLFTANLTVGGAEKPITIPGGEAVVEPITGGYLTGSYVNATVHSGIAHPTIMQFDNQTSQSPFIQLWGATTDNETFFVSVDGVGFPHPQVARAVRTSWNYSQAPKCLHITVYRKKDGFAC